MGNIRKTALLLILSIIAAGCQTPPPPQATAQDNLRAKTLRPLPGYALVYVVRPEPDSKNRPVKILADDIQIGKTVGGDFLALEIKAGEHRISAKTAFSKYNLDMEFKEGRKYFIRLVLVKGKYSYEPKFKLMEEKEGKKELERCTLSLMK